MKGKKKKEILQEHNDGNDNNNDCDDDNVNVKHNNDCDGNDVDVNIPNLGVGNEVDGDDNDESTKIEERAKTCSKELNSLIEDTTNLDGPFWANGTIGFKTGLYILSATTLYNNIDGLHGLISTPQYGFNRGIKEGGQAG